MERRWRGPTLFKVWNHIEAGFLGNEAILDPLKVRSKPKRDLCLGTH